MEGPLATRCARPKENTDRTTTRFKHPKCARDVPELPGIDLDLMDETVDFVLKSLTRGS